MTGKQISRAACLSLVALGLLTWTSHSHAQTEPTPVRFRLAVPDKKWALELTVLTVQQPLIGVSTVAQLTFANPIESFTDDGKTAWLSAYQNRQNGSDLPYLVVQVQPATQFLTAEEFRAFAFKSLTKNAHGEKHLKHNHTPIARYRTDGGAAGSYREPITDTVNVTLTARNLEAYLVKDDIWVRIRFTARSITREGEQLFYSVVDSARFVDVSNPANSLDYYSIGRTFSAKKEFRRAAECFGAAVELEKNQPQLDAEHWQDLIKKSAEAHAAMSDLSGAVEILEYAATREPTNAKLLMELARTYASLRDSEKTLATLKEAFVLLKREQEIFEKTKFRVPTWPTLLLPDVNRDPAFKELMKDKSFRDTVKALKK